MFAWLKGGAARLSAWNKARMERITVRRAERQAQREADQHHHSRFFLLTVPAIATLCAAVTEWVWALLFCIEATGHLDLNYEARVGSTSPLQSLWDFSFSAHWPVLIGLILATAPIVMISMVWLPVQFGMRGAGVWRRGTLIFAGVLANILVVISGTVVMNYNRQESVREALVVEQSADAQRAMLTASVDDLRGELDTLMNHRSTYVATAASVGAVAYERDYVRQARATNDPRLPLLERALGSARRADDLRDQIRQARSAVATAIPAAASAANVEDDVGRDLNRWSQIIEVWRPPFVAFICTVIGIFGAWWVLAMLERMNPKDVLRSGWADEGHRIEDMREQEPIASQPYERQTVMREENPDTGEVRVQVQPKPHWRTVKKGTKQQVSIPGEVEVEYEGRRFTTSGSRQEEASGAGGWGTHGPSVAKEEVRDPEQKLSDDNNASESNAGETDQQRDVQPDSPIELPDLTDEEQAAIEAELADAGDVYENPEDDNAHQDADAHVNASGENVAERQDDADHGDDQGGEADTLQEHPVDHPDLPEPESHEPERRPGRLLTNVAAE